MTPRNVTGFNFFNARDAFEISDPDTMFDSRRGVIFFFVSSSLQVYKFSLFHDGAKNSSSFILYQKITCLLYLISNAIRVFLIIL